MSFQLILSFLLAKAVGGDRAEGAPPEGIRSAGTPAQERNSPRGSDIVVGPADGPALAAPWPGEFALKTYRGFYVTAIHGGGRSVDPIILTNATTAGPWEKFRLPETSPDTPYDRSIQTVNGNYLTAVNGGGLSGDAFHTDATQALGWERFRFLDLSSGDSAPGYYALATINGSYVTAVGAGGKVADALHSDARQIQDWEKFRIVKCGDVGSGLEYGIMAADGSFLSAVLPEGQSPGTLDRAFGASAKTRFRLFQQNDGSYALQTLNGVTFVTALNGGGLVEKYYFNCDSGVFGACLESHLAIFHTDATQVRAWEKFRLLDQGNCTYAIQTASGFNVGIYQGSDGRPLLTTRRDGVSTPNELFQLVVYGLASPVISQ
jgi:hypothetical protein